MKPQKLILVVVMLIGSLAKSQSIVPINKFKPQPIVGEWLYVQGVHPFYDKKWVDTLVNQIGIKGLRVGLEWFEIEKTKGDYSWAIVDSMFKIKDRYNLKYLATPGYGNGLYSAGGEGQSQFCRSFDMSTEAEMDAYVNFLKIAINRYKGKGVIWEILNEPDLFIYNNDPSGCRTSLNNITQAQQGILYATLLKKVAVNVRPLFPNEIIVTGGLAYAGSEFTNSYIDKAATERTFNAFDAFSFHEYQLAIEKCRPNDQTLSSTWKLNTLKKRLENNGYLNTTFLNTETGGSGHENTENSKGDSRWDGFDPDGSLDLNQQAAYFVRTYLFGLSNSSSLYAYHQIKDDKSRPLTPDSERHTYGIFDTLSKRKPVFYSMRSLLQQLNNYKLIQNNSQCNTLDQTNWKMLNTHLVFGKNTDTTHVVWAVQDATGNYTHARVVRINLSNGNYKTTGMLGQNYGITTVTNGYTDILVDEQPVYLAKMNVTTEVTDFSIKNFSNNLIFPNPAQDFITIDANKFRTINIYDAIGNIVMNQAISEAKINISQLVDGLYVAEMVEANGVSVRSKLVVNK